MDLKPCTLQISCNEDLIRRLWFIWMQAYKLSGSCFSGSLIHIADIHSDPPNRAASLRLLNEIYHEHEKDAIPW